MGNRLIRWILFWSSCLFLHLNNAHALESESIVGGTRAPKCKYNYQVSIQLKENHLCGGAILSENHVITAAHCTIDENQGTDFVGLDLKVVAGTTNWRNLDESAVSIKVDKIYLRKEYVPGKTGHDIAVLRLVSPLDLTNNPCLDYVTLPAPSNFYERADATATGFGSISSTNKRTFGKSEREDIVLNDYLNFIKTKVISNYQCQKKYLGYKTLFPQLPYVKLDNSFICVESVATSLVPPRGTCKGDSGSPIVTGKNVLIGIVNLGPLNCDEFYAPGMHARVSSHLLFIHRAMEDDKTCQTIVFDHVTMCIIDVWHR